MTDTTDIKALRVQIDTPGVGSVAQLRKLAHYLLDLLEAERQRAGAVPDHVITIVNQQTEILELTERAEKAEARVKELEGDQVPIAWLNDAHLHRGHIEGEAGEEDAGPGMIPVYRERYTAPQKPVVLPGIGGVEPTSAPEFVNYADGWRDGINECRKAIEAAGGIVKDGE